MADTIDKYSLQLFSNGELKSAIEQYKKSSDYDRYLILNKIRNVLAELLLQAILSTAYILLLLTASFLGVPTDPVISDVNAIKDQDYYKMAKEGNGRAVWQPAHKNNFVLGGNSVLSYIRLKKDKEYIDDLGILIINVKPYIIQKALANTKIGKSGYMFIVDANGSIISHPDISLLGKNIKEDASVKDAFN